MDARYIPESLDLSLESTNPDLFHSYLARVTKEVHGDIRRSGKYMFDYAPIHYPKPLPVFFRIITHPRLTFQDLDQMLEDISTAGERLFEEFEDDSASVQSR
ncbi:hypothetical protein K493DRAFT_41383 [Basidiobolus meristosporus CBS 931.73]|uniref:PLP-dependent transferase n=1 Tax=Basidiobolus meristosporus CBS 931.73 TaxID=1314790 RepID=A0A1Y1Y400_9FUNG|nr:hypothetical protein K493DRAFT_91597 [Basidiobolus meristosporus CBS 931.73]ORX92718.1 hypothetical protein K493DRAFT_41383 [Basidiobolus meristosporus CBS 931.73]|eukprot:ORX82489.1 hypothetical protein K493DRAFT_91597 [Basidiobolus meristosporus CBS 931.73]